jgi:hypothetical protein
MAGSAGGTTISSNSSLLNFVAAVRAATMRNSFGC